jgi:hypothetical protein
MLPTHVAAGLIAASTDGRGYTVTVFDVEHPPTVYDIAVLPAPAPVTTPVELFTVAMPVFPLDQVPPAVRSLNVAFARTHILVVPVIFCGD